MKETLKKIIDKLSNPLIFYINKNGNSVFKNFCIFKNDGMYFENTITAKEAGKVLEYRIKLAKYLKYFAFILFILFYFWTIHSGVNLFNILKNEFLYIILYFVARLVCLDLYLKKVKSEFGQYSVCDFTPSVSEEKQKSFNQRLINKAVIILIALIVFISPAFIIINSIKSNIKNIESKYKQIETLTNLYSFFYPQNQYIFEVKAYTKYVEGDFVKAAENFLRALKAGGKTFTDKDLIRFSNLLILLKKSSGSQNAIDIFNEYITTKKMTVSQQTKMLWIKSIFSIENQIPDFVVQDYDDLLLSLNEKDAKNKFYILADKAYMLYLIGDYKGAINIYNSLIPFATQNHENFSQDLKKLYIERGYAKKMLNDKLGADADFVHSKVDMYDVQKFKPYIPKYSLVIE